MMAEGRRAVVLDGQHMMVWGSLIGTAFFVQYAAVIGAVGAIVGTLGWAVAIVLGWALSAWIGARTAGRRPGNKLTALYATAFIGTGVVLTLTAVIGWSTGTLDPRGITVTTCGLLGVAFLVTAVATEIGWLRLVAVGWWALLALFLVRPALSALDLLVMGAAMWGLVLLPGLRLIVLQRRADGRAATGCG
ncbi:hypothetical protein [Rhodothalassium salexigens]|nr:hypothetical protein [Rhodothalassium salexigens]